MKNPVFVAFLIGFCLQFLVLQAQKPVSAGQLKQDSLLQHFGTPGHLLIKGNVRNFDKDFFEFALTSYLDNETKAVPVKPDGSFEQQFEVSNRQDVYLYLPGSNTIILTVMEGDTLTLTWDHKDLTKSFHIQSDNPIRNQQLQVQWAIYLNHRQPFLNLNRELQDKKDSYTPDQKFQRINDEYNKVLRTILSAGRGKKVLDNLLIDQYYDFSNLLLNNGLYPTFVLKANPDSLPPIKMDTLTVRGETLMIPEYEVFGIETRFPWFKEAHFVSSNNYRQFISEFLRQSNPYYGTTILTGGINQTNLPLAKYYRIRGSQGSALIQDWLSANLLRNEFRYSKLDYSAEAYQLFLTDCKTPFFRKAVQQAYDFAQLLQPGKTAPSFTLKDENGKEVSLSDFSGKVVYMDFWGVYCGPCIYDIENILPKIHDYYQDKEIVFINICVDVNEAEWKKGLKKYPVHGVNLIAEGWNRNPVCQAYNIQGIPSYALINKDGTIASTTLMPYQLTGNLGNTELDKALLK